MNVDIRFNNSITTIKLKGTASVKSIMNQIHKEMGILPSEQRLIYRGRDLSTSDLQGMTSGAKILLLKRSAQSSDEKKRPASKRGRPASPANTILDKTIISRGPPPGCRGAEKLSAHQLPKDPFIVYDTRGTVSKLSFESDNSIFIVNDRDNERIFMHKVTSGLEDGSLFQDLPGPYNNQYVALVFVIEATPRVFYFIPKQYQTIIQDLFKCARMDAAK